MSRSRTLEQVGLSGDGQADSLAGNTQEEVFPRPALAVRFSFFGCGLGFGNFMCGWLRVTGAHGEGDDLEERRT